MSETKVTKAQEVLGKVIALRNYSRETGMKVWKSENALMNALQPNDLAEVAQGLMDHKLQFGW
jgi:hypothetical protein